MTSLPTINSPPAINLPPDVKAQPDVKGGSAPVRKEGVAPSTQSLHSTKEDVPRATAATSTEQLGSALERIKEFVQPAASDITFSIDEDTGTTVVKVIDRETKDVIRQIPSEEVLAIAKALDSLKGLLIRQKA